jgi:hypothetical protein
MIAMPLRHAAAALALAAFALPAAAQNQKPYKDAFKGKIREGEYEMKLELDMGGKGKHGETKKQCVTPKDLDQGLEGDKNCGIRNFKSTANGVSFTAECTGKDAVVSENTMTFTPEGYSAETRTTQKVGAEEVKSTLRIQSRYLGPCKKQEPAKK